MKPDPFEVWYEEYMQGLDAFWREETATIRKEFEAMQKESEAGEPDPFTADYKNWRDPMQRGYWSESEATGED